MSNENSKNGKMKRKSGDYESVNQEEIDNKPCCDRPLLKETEGFFVCQNCGMVHEEVILDNSPRRAFTQDEIAKRKSDEPVYSPIGPRTVIRGSTDAKGTLLSPKGKMKYHRLAKIQRSLTTSYERNLWIALPNLQRLQERLNIPDSTAEDALRIYTHAVKQKLTMGRSIDTLLAAAIFASLRIHGIPRTIEEIVEAAELPKDKVLKSYKLLRNKILGDMKLQVVQFGPINFIDKFVGELKLSMDTRNKAVDILKTAKKSGLPTAGKDPKGLAAAAIYIASKLTNESKTQSEIANICKVTEVTLRMRQKELKQFAFDKAGKSWPI
jgi:transcription initiation factor TFIIB